MPITYEIDSELPSGQDITIEVLIYPLIPGKTNCLPEDAHPHEDGYAEFQSAYITANGKRIAVELEDLWIRYRKLSSDDEWEFQTLIEHYEEYAYNAWADSH